jgi:hypothetical protein
MEAKRFSKVTDREGYYFPVKRAASVAVGVLFVTVLAGAGEPAGRDPNSRATVPARQADGRDGAAHKDAAKALLGQHYQDCVVRNDIRTVTGLSGGPGMEAARQNAETIIGHCQRALALAVQDAEVYWMMGEGYFLQKQYREAIGAGLEALQIKPDFYPALHLLIRAHSREGEYEKALDYCLRALAIRPRGISTPHLSYFYSICKRLTVAGRYATVLSYCEKLTELSSQMEIGCRWPEYDLAKETSHAKYYLNNPTKGYPPTLALPGSPRFGWSEELSAQEKQRLMAPLNQIAVSCSSPSITVTAVSAERKGILSQAQIVREWGGAIHGDIGAFEIEFKGKLKEWMDSRGDFDPSDFRDEINRTKAEAVKGFLQQAAPHLGIPEYVLRDLGLSDGGYRLMYSQELTFKRRDRDWSDGGCRLAYSQPLTYKGVPLRIYDRATPGFAVDWGPRDLRKRNAFSICNYTLYTLPAADIPVEPLVTEKQAREIATEALEKEAHSGVRQEGSLRSDDNPAGRGIRIGQVALCIQPELLSFGDTIDNTIDTDLFDPVCQFAEYRLLWLLWVARDGGFPAQVKVDAITGETLAIKALGMI